MDLKVSTGNFPVSLLYLTIALPITSKGGNQLLYVTGVDTQAVSRHTQLLNLLPETGDAQVSCHVGSIADHPQQVKDEKSIISASQRFSITGAEIGVVSPCPMFDITFTPICIFMNHVP